MTMHPVQWTEQDLSGTARAADVWWTIATDGVDPLPAALAAQRAELERLVDVLRGPSPFAERATAGTELVERLSAIGRDVHRLGRGPQSTHGRVASINVSDGGVPKLPVGRVRVGWRGVEGDRQASRRHHGRVFQALSLWSAEVIAALRAEGHPVHPGAAGENITVSALEWAALRPGTRLRLGTVLAEVTVPAIPCAKNAQWFVDGDFNRIHYERHPGRSRQYALVVEPGEVAVGDDVLVEP
jgi:MOSC domain-containing protein YiiM